MPTPPEHARYEAPRTLQKVSAVRNGAQASVAPIRPAVVTVYSQSGCHLCDEALARLRELRAELGFDLRERDIACEDALYRAYFERIPVILLDGEELCDYVLDEQMLRERLESRA